MKTSVPELIVGDVILTNGFIGRVVERVEYSDRVGIQLEFIHGNSFNFNYLSGRITGNHLAYVDLLEIEFIPE